MADFKIALFFDTMKKAYLTCRWLETKQQTKSAMLRENIQQALSDQHLLVPESSNHTNKHVSS